MPIEFARSDTGKLVPLQRLKSTYWVDGDGVAQRVADADGGAVYANHWETCPGASAVKARQKKGG